MTKTLKTIAEVAEEFLTTEEIDHYVIGVDYTKILNERFELLAQAHFRVEELSKTGDHMLIDIEARDADGEMLRVVTVYEEEEE